jgi:hypothetical protein
MLVFRNRALRKRPGNVAARLLRPGKKRWVAGHGIWVNDVFAFRGSPAAWTEVLLPVTAASARSASAGEQKKLHRLGDDSVVAMLEVGSGDGRFDVAARPGDRALLLGPFDPGRAP